MAKKAGKKSAGTGQPRYDLPYVKQMANGRWPEILQATCGLDADLLDGREHPCPNCKGNTRFRFTDLDGNGSTHCGTCPDGKCGSGFDAVMFVKKCTFAEALAIVAEHLGIEPTEDAAGNGEAKRKSKLEFLEWNEMTVAYWCLSKKPVTTSAVLACGGRLANYHTMKGVYKVIALPVWGAALGGPDAATNLPSEPAGWCMYSSIGGGLLPRFEKNKDTGKWEIAEWVKVKLFHGSEAGWMGPVEKLATASTVWKLEGPSDLLSFYSLPDIPDDVVAVTNFAGAREKPKKWMLESLAGKIVNVLHDADVAGEEGAIGVTKNGKSRLGWVQLIAEHAAETHHVRLPYEILPNHGKDLRDYCIDLLPKNTDEQLPQNGATATLK
jgi:hypothetical protein